MTWKLLLVVGLEYKQCFLEALCFTLVLYGLLNILFLILVSNQSLAYCDLLCSWELCIVRGLYFSYVATCLQQVQDTAKLEIRKLGNC